MASPAASLMARERTVLHVVDLARRSACSCWSATGSRRSGSPARTEPPVVLVRNALAAERLTSLWNRSKPAARLRSRKRGSVKLRSICMRSCEPASRKRRNCPRPSRLRSEMRDVADHAFTGRVARAERQLAGRLLDQLDIENDAVGRGARPALDLDGLEEAQLLQPLLGLVDHQRIVGIAFRQAELAADHVVPRARVADDVDALDVDARDPRRSRR